MMLIENNICLYVSTTIRYSHALMDSKSEEMGKLNDLFTGMDRWLGKFYDGVNK